MYSEEYIMILILTSVKVQITTTSFMEVGVTKISEEILRTSSEFQDERGIQDSQILRTVRAV